MDNKTSIVRTFSYWMYAIVFVLISAFLSVWTYYQFKNYADDLYHVENQYMEIRKSAIKNQVLSVVKQIEHTRSRIKLNVENELKNKAYEAHAIALNIYNQNRDILPEDKVKKLIVNALTAVRYNKGRGRIFVVSLNGIQGLSGNQPEIEGKNILHIQDVKERYIFREMINIAKKSKEGFYEYLWQPVSGHTGKELHRITFVKRFEPYGWVIGTGDYFEDAEKDVQKELLAWMNDLNFGEDSYIAAFTFEGVRIAFVKKEELGQNKWDFVDPNGVKVVQEGIKLSKTGEGGFIEYIGTIRPTTGKPAHKISFFAGVPDWRWAISTGTYLDEVDMQVERLKKEQSRAILRSVLYSIAVLLTLWLIVFFVLTLISKRLTTGFQAFISFFERAAKESVLIDGGEFSFSEFQALAASANHMIDERRKAEEALRGSEEEYKMLANNLPAFIYKGFADWSVNFYDDKVEELTGYGKEEFDLRKVKWNDLVLPEDLNGVMGALKKALHGNKRYVREYRIRNKEGNVIWMHDRGQVILNKEGKIDYISGVIFDTTERKQLESNLVQAQKMEAVGKLAGGVAHDFNNLLTAIIGHSHIILERVKGDQKLTRDVEQIRKAGEHAASLTRQLLAFSRKQVLQPKVINLNVVLADTEKMLKRLIGEDIDLVVNQSPYLGLVMADSGQIEQVIMNLAINARDAMPSGGKLTIETENAELDDTYAKQHPYVTPGSFVLLAVSDTGAGMDKETLSRIFEPFFTTKEMSKGTGLGLSTVYGIVKQSGGHIWVYSEPGKGSTFKIYLPRVYEGMISSKAEIHPSEWLEKGSETLLLVEDDDIVRDMTAEILRECGYTVMEACNGEEAILVSEGYEDLIHLMVTDVVMPGMSGRELAIQMETLRPEMKVLYISGYTDDAIVHHGVLERGVAFLQKPFTPPSLAKKVREVLGTVNEG